MMTMIGNNSRHKAVDNVKGQGKGGKYSVFMWKEMMKIVRFREIAVMAMTCMIMAMLNVRLKK